MLYTVLFDAFGSNVLIAQLQAADLFDICGIFANVRSSRTGYLAAARHGCAVTIACVTGSSFFCDTIVIAMGMV